MIQSVKKHIETNKLFTPNDKIIVGVSGGADSMALVHILLELGYSCVAAHCNFNLREEESDNDAAFVHFAAQKLGIEWVQTSFNTQEYASKQGISIEMAARDLRYNWFEKIRLAHNAQYIAVAHHADDNVETLLMQLTRGTGLKGLTGMPVQNGKVVRPLLSCTRTQIIDYLENKQITYVTDSSNAENKYVRNRFRNEIIPLFEAINPAFKQKIAQTIEILNEVEQIYNESIATKTAQICWQTKNGVEIDIVKLKQEKCFKTLLFEFLNPFGFHTDTIDSIAMLDNAVSGLEFHSASHILLVDRKKYMVQHKSDTNSDVFCINITDTSIETPVKMDFNLLNSNKIIHKQTNFANLDADKIVYPLQLRKWNPGDIFYPFGMTKRKKISDFFIDLKISKFDKQNTWILTSNNEIVWVVGMRIDNRFAVTDDTKNILQIEFKQ